MASLRIIFLGTAELACPSLVALCRQPEVQVVSVVTQPDRPRGRDLRPQPPPVKVQAEKLKLPVHQPERARQPEFIEAVRALAPDLLVVAAYGQILAPALLEIPRHGCVNVHASLLPKYRGAAPIQWAILNDEAETGVTIMQVDAGLDTGPILSQIRTPIAPEDNGQTLHDRLARLGADLLVQTIPEYVAGTIRPQPQPETGAIYAAKITKEDGHLDWTQPARALWNRVRAFTPWPGTFTFLPATPKRVLLKIWSARIAAERSGPPAEVLQADKQGIVVGCGRQALRLLEVQPAGRRRMTTAEFLAGHRLPAGERLL